MYIVTLITLERQAVFITSTAGCESCMHPAVSPERIRIFRCGFHQSVENHEHIIYDVLEIKNFQATPTKIKMAALRPDVNLTSWLWYNQISDSNLNLLRSSNSTRRHFCGYSPTSEWLINQRWPPLTGSTYAMSYISACIQNINDIPRDSNGYPHIFGVL